MLVKPKAGESWQNAIQRALDRGHAVLPSRTIEVSGLTVPDFCVIEALPGARIVGDPIFETRGTVKRVRVLGGLWQGLTWRHRGGVLSYCSFEHMALRGRSGFRLDGAVGCLWRRVECFDLDTGFRIGENGATNQNVWRDCRWVRGRAGVVLVNLDDQPIKGNHFDGCWFEEVTEFGLRLAPQALGTTVRDSWFEDIPQPIIGWGDLVTLSSTRFAGRVFFRADAEADEAGIEVAAPEDPG